MSGSLPPPGRVPFLIFLMFPLLLHNTLGAASERGSDAIVEEATCNQPDCLRCELDTGRCTKCLYVMMAVTRECRNTCPDGYTTSWADSKDYMGRICTERQMLTLVSGQDITLIAGAAVGGAICVGMIIGGLLYMKQRTKPVLDDTNSLPRKRMHRMGKDKRPNTAEMTLNGPDREEFFSKLSPLRGEINNFVDILKETRTRFKVPGKPDSATDTKAKSYRAVVRDLSRVVSLMNRKDEHIKTVPQDWRRLLTWAARVLDRYKRQKEAKGSEGINTIEPLSSCSLYQTRRQAQKERCKLFTQCRPITQDLSKDSDTDMAPSCKSSSCASSMVSLAHIFDEAEEDLQEKSDKIKDLNDNEFMQNMEFMENTKNEMDDLYSDEFNQTKNNQNPKSMNEAPEQPPVSFKVVNEGINCKILKEKNNNSIAQEGNLNSITRLNNMINECYLSSTNINGSLKKYKSKELEFFNSLQTPVFKPVEASNSMEAKLNAKNKAIPEQKKGKPIRPEMQGQTKFIINAEIKPKLKLKPNSDKKMINRSNKENKQPKPPVPPKPKALMRCNQQSSEKTEATYTNVTKKSVTYPCDTYRDDIIEQVHVSSSKSVDTTNSNEISTKVMKTAENKELSLPARRIELITNL